MAARYSQRPRAPSPPASPLPARNHQFDARRDNQHSNTGDNFAFLRQQSQNQKNFNPIDDSDAYSIVQDEDFRFIRKGIEPQPGPLPPKTKIDRMFGDSANEEDDILTRKSRQQQQNDSIRLHGSISSNASSRRGGSLASLYQARKSMNYDTATVEQIKAQFQVIR